MHICGFDWIPVPVDKFMRAVEMRKIDEALMGRMRLMPFADYIDEWRAINSIEVA